VNRIRDKILSYSSVNELELNSLIEFFKPIHLKKGEYLFREGDIVDQFYFVDKGILMFYRMIDGTEKVIEFYLENEFTTDLFSFIKNEPTVCSVRALEDVIVYSIPKKFLEDHYSKSIDLQKFGRKLVESEYMKLMIRSSHKDILSNEERYLRLMDRRHDLSQRVPQYLIASYLGLTPVGLSKIRKRISQN
jgi:CRP-like cAMP-binding protein